MHQFSLFPPLQRTCLALESCPPKKKTCVFVFPGETVGHLAPLTPHPEQDSRNSPNQWSAPEVKKNWCLCSLLIQNDENFPELGFFCKPFSGKAFVQGFWGEIAEMGSFLFKIWFQISWNILKKFTWMHNHLKALTRIVYSTQHYLNQDLAYKSQI